ncbi:MAG: outer membrane protein assembly factor BamD [Chitinophagales bacterium]
MNSIKQQLSVSSQPVKKNILIIFAIIMVFLSACNTPEKVLKNADPNYKYTKAMEWYNKGAYYKAIPVFEELMGLYKGVETVEEIYYYYCMAQYNQGSYIVAAYHFKQYTVQHPYSQYAEEALFMHAECYDQQSPKSSLDQSETYNAIDAYQNFINAYPSSERITYCNDKIDELRQKLEDKALAAADLYYRTKNYRAAAFAYKNLLISYPDVDGSEDIQYKIVESYYKYAEQSIIKKQQERFEETIAAADNFLSRYETSEYFSLVEDVKEQSHYDAIQSSFEYAMNFIAEKRVDKLDEVVNVYDVHTTSINDEKLKKDAKEVLEEMYFQKIKTNFEHAQESVEAERRDLYNATIDAYYNFNQKYSNSKFTKEADKIFNASEKNLKKLS